MGLYLELGALPVKKISGAQRSIRESLARLRKYVGEQPFRDEAAEIAFFKYDKPRFLCEQIYTLEILTIRKPAARLMTMRPLNISSKRSWRLSGAFLRNTGSCTSITSWGLRTWTAYCFCAGLRPRISCCRMERTRTRCFRPTGIFLLPSLWRWNGCRNGWWRS